MYNLIVGLFSLFFTALSVVWWLLFVAFQVALYVGIAILVIGAFNVAVQ